MQRTSRTSRPRVRRAVGLAVAGLALTAAVAACGPVGSTSFVIDTADLELTPGVDTNVPITVRNIGALPGPLSFSTSTEDGVSPISVKSLTCQGAIAPGASCDLEVTIGPGTTAGELTLSVGGSSLLVSDSMTITVL